MLSIVFFALQAALYLIAPSAILFLFGLTASYSDSRGVIEYIDAAVPGYAMASRLLFGMMLLISVARYFSGVRRLAGSLVREIGDAALVLMMLIVISFVANGLGLLRGIQDLYFHPVSYLFMLLVIGRDRSKFYVSYIAVQISLALIILSVPAFSVLDARYAIAATGEYVGGQALGELDASSLRDVNKIDIGQYAQFQNPNTLGFYAGIAIAYGLASFLQNRLRFTAGVQASFFLAVGSLAWLASLTRGPILGVIFASGLSLTRIPRSSWMWIAASGVVALVLVGGSVFEVGGDFFGYLIPDAENISVAGRFDGYLNGLGAVLDSPFWGVVNQWDWDLGVPHFLLLHYAAQNGIPAAIVSLGIFYIIPFRGFLLVWRKGAWRGRVVSAFFVYSVVVAISVTNNAPGVCLFGFSMAYIVGVLDRALTVPRRGQ